jgi:hypothetical protein
MEKSTENKNHKNFLKEGVKGDISKHHTNYLGTNIPENYFAKSKISILEKIKSEEIKEKKPLVFWMQPQFRYIAAASLVFILSLTVWLQNVNKNDDFNTNNFELLSFSDDILINSLLVEDSELEAFAETTLMNEVIIKAELSEQKMDNLFLNSLILEDSLTDDYINYELLETIIL